MKFGFIDFPQNWPGMINEEDFHHNSSFVGRVDYNPDTQQMEISLNNIVYEYCSIPLEIFEGFESALSKGSFYNENIKGKFAC